MNAVIVHKEIAGDYSVAMKKIQTYKIIVIIAILTFLVLSCFPCVVATAHRGEPGESYKVTTTQNNISWVTVISLVAQIVFVLLHRRGLQLIAGLVGVFPGLLCPLVVYAMNEILDNIVYIMPSNGPSYMEMTVNGWIVTILACMMIGLDVFVSVRMKKEPILDIEVPQKRDEVE